LTIIGTQFLFFVFSPPFSDGESWWNGKDGYRELISLDPAAKSGQTNGKSDNGTETATEIEVRIFFILNLLLHHLGFVLWLTLYLFTRIFLLL
jgi:hypothetical protein